MNRNHNDRMIAVNKYIAIKLTDSQEDHIDLNDRNVQRKDVEIKTETVAVTILPS